MLTDKQKKWVNHLSNDSKIRIVPFDSSCIKKFEKVKSIIQFKLGKTAKVEHHGATRLKISGQDEIDIYVPVASNLFNSYITSLTELFGEPRSCYPLERARFVTSVDEKHIDVFLIVEDCTGWLECINFEQYLLATPDALEKYRQLKESGDGLSTREYYRRKLEFINHILEKA